MNVIVSKRKRGRPKIEKDDSFKSLSKQLLIELTNKINSISFERSGKKQRARADKEFGKVISFIKKIPHFLSVQLETGKYYKTSFKSNKINCLKGLLEPFCGFLKFFEPFEDLEMKTRLFLEFICIYHSEKKVIPLLQELVKEGSIPKSEQERLLLCIKNRKSTGITKNVQLCKSNQSLRFCVFLTERLLREIEVETPQLQEFKLKLESLLVSMEESSASEISSN